MNQYRLRIDELHNGTKKYYVQKMYLRIIKGWTQRQEISWEDFTSAYDTEEDAMRMVEALKRIDQDNLDKRVKSTTYKDV